MERRERSKHFPLCLPDNQPPKRIDHHPRLRSALKFSFSRDFPSSPYPSLEVDLSPFSFSRVLSWSRIKLIRRQSVVLRKQGNERRMGEEMGETEGKGGEEKEGLSREIHFTFPWIPPSFFIHPCKSRIIWNQPTAMSTLHLTPKVLICSKATISTLAIYIYIYVYVRLSRGREWGWKKSLDTLRPSNDVPAVPHPLDNTANPRRRWSSFHPGFPPRGSRNHLQPLIFIRATPASFITSFSSSNRLLDT